MASKIAQTRVRLKSYVTLKVVPEGWFWDPTTDDDRSLFEQTSQLITVGAAQSLTINQERSTNQERREFANNRWGVGDSVKPVETYPGIVSYEVELERVDLYDKNLLQAFGIDGYNIVDQYKPLVLFVEQPVPEIKIGNPGKNLTPITRIVTGCWIDKFPVEYSVTDDDQKYVVTITMVAQDVIMHKPK